MNVWIGVGFLGVSHHGSGGRVLPRQIVAHASSEEVEMDRFRYFFQHWIVFDIENGILEGRGVPAFVESHSYFTVQVSATVSLQLGRLHCARTCYWRE